MFEIRRCKSLTAINQDSGLMVGEKKKDALAARGRWCRRWNHFVRLNDSIQSSIVCSFVNFENLELEFSRRPPIIMN